MREKRKREGGILLTLSSEVWQSLPPCSFACVPAERRLNTETFPSLSPPLEHCTWSAHFLTAIVLVPPGACRKGDNTCPVGLGELLIMLGMNKGLHLSHNGQKCRELRKR